MGNFLDIAIIIVCLLLTITGLTSGFVKRAYDFIGTIVALVLAYFLSSSVNISFLTPFITNNTLFYPLLDQVVSFVVLFIIFWIIKKLLGLVIKPLLTGLIKIIPFTGFINKVLGLALGFVEGVIICYIGCLVLITPFVDGGYDLVNESILGNQLLEIVPQYTDQVMSLREQYDLVDDSSSFDSNTLSTLIDYYQRGLIDQSQIESYIENNVTEEMVEENKDILQSINLSASQRQELVDILNSSSIDSSLKQKILQYIR